MLLKSFAKFCHLETLLHILPPISEKGRKNKQNYNRQNFQTLKLLRPTVLPLRPTPQIHSPPILNHVLTYISRNITCNSGLHLLIVDMVKYYREFREYMPIIIKRFVQPFLIFFLNKP